MMGRPADVAVLLRHQAEFTYEPIYAESPTTILAARRSRSAYCERSIAAEVMVIVTIEAPKETH